MDVVAAGTLDLSSGSARIKIEGKEPEMLLVEVVADGMDVHPDTPTMLLGAAVSPTQLKPSVDRPADFDAFWKKKLEELAQVPMHPLVVPVPSPKADVSLSTFKLDSVGSHVQGYLAKPDKPGKYPALIMLQHAGIFKLNPEASVGYASRGWLVLDVGSHDMAPTDDKGAPNGYAMIGMKDRDQSYFLKMFLRDTRAVDYLTTLKEWDGKTIVLTGVSLGGEQSFATAALRPDLITAVLVNEPAGADTNGDLHGRRAGYPFWPSNDPEVMKTALYFDPVNFAPSIRATTIIGVGFIDTTAPPAGIYTVYNLIQAPKEIIPFVDASHHDAKPVETQAAYTKRLREALETLVHTGSLPLAP